MTGRERRWGSGDSKEIKFDPKQSNKENPRYTSIHPIHGLIGPRTNAHFQSTRRRVDMHLAAAVTNPLTALKRTKPGQTLPNQSSTETQLCAIFVDAGGRRGGGGGGCGCGGGSGEGVHAHGLSGAISFHVDAAS